MNKKTITLSVPALKFLATHLGASQLVWKNLPLAVEVSNAISNAKDAPDSTPADVQSQQSS